MSEENANHALAILTAQCEANGIASIQADDGQIFMISRAKLLELLDTADKNGKDRVILFVWALGGGLAALGGVLFGLQQQVHFEMGFRLLLLMFAGVTLGGLGTAYGALVGSFVVGMFVEVSTLVIPTELKNVGALFVLIIVLLFRPQGILGRAERIG